MRRNTATRKWGDVRAAGQLRLITWDDVLDNAFDPSGARTDGA
jgi:hypothetical protein